MVQYSISALRGRKGEREERDDKLIKRETEDKGIERQRIYGKKVRKRGMKEMERREGEREGDKHTSIHEHSTAVSP